MWRFALAIGAMLAITLVLGQLSSAPAPGCQPA
jgi:hypothetical protein